MALCVCLSCGRTTDCGGDQICELCEADKPAMARMQVSSSDATTGPYVLIDGCRVVSQVEAAGWVEAKSLLEPGLEQRIARVIDIPRP